MLLPGCGCCQTGCTLEQSYDLWTRLQSRSFSVSVAGTTVAVPAYAQANNVAEFSTTASQALNAIRNDVSRTVYYYKQQAANVHLGTYALALSVAGTKWQNPASGTLRNGYITFLYEDDLVRVQLIIWLSSFFSLYEFQLPGESCYVSMQLRTVLKYKFAEEPISRMIDDGQYQQWTISAISPTSTYYAVAVGTPEAWRIVESQTGFAVGYPNHGFATTGKIDALWFSDVKPAALAWQDGEMVSRCSYLTPSTTPLSYVPVAGVNASCTTSADVIQAPLNGTFVGRSSFPMSSIRSSFEPITSGLRDDIFYSKGVAPANGPMADNGIQNGPQSSPTISLSMSST